MPASALTVRVTLQRGCPACGDNTCADPAECLYFLTSRPWADCCWCAGSGFAGESSSRSAVFCDGCNGSGLEEHSIGSITPEEISDNAHARHAVYVDALRARLASPSRAVAA